MSDATAIQWTDSTWNIVTGCTRVSPGCAHCYIERTPPFRMAHRRFERVGSEETTGVTLHWDRLAKPPRGPKIFTPSLGDLFHEDVPYRFIGETFDAFAAHPDRIFQVLTKRPERARDVLQQMYAPFAGYSYDERGAAIPTNVWLGVSIENARYTWRADVLREIPAAVRFISAEPLLGPLVGSSRRPGPREDRHLRLHGIDWLIIGGESGPGARPMRLSWVEELLACGREHKVALFVKQLGSAPIHGLTLHDAKGGDWDEWPADLRIREFPMTGSRL